MGESRLNMLGPWRGADIRSLMKLCSDASSIGGPESQIGGGLMTMAAYQPSPYPDFAAAKQVLYKHRIYRWLKQRDPPILREMPKDDPLAEFRFIGILLRCMTIAFHLAESHSESPSESARERRMDKQRTTAWGAFDRAEQYLRDGTVWLLDSTRHNLLIELLHEAKAELMSRHPKARPAGQESYPALKALADALYKELGIQDVSLIKAVSQAIGSGCSDKTAQRYVDQAVQS